MTRSKYNAKPQPSGVHDRLQFPPRSAQQEAISRGMKLAWKRRKANAAPTPSEAQIHRSVAEYLAGALKPPTIWTTIGHGGGGRVRGAQLKAMGVQKGWPDILVMYSPDDRIACGVLGIELKAEGKYQKPEQRAVEAAFKDCHAWYVLCRSVEEVEKALRFCKVPLSASVARAA